MSRSDQELGVAFIIMCIGLVHACPSQCTCEVTVEGTKVDCKDTQIGTAKLSDYPQDTVQLDLSDNPITAIGDGDFPRLPRLKSLILNDCRIRSISAGAFTSSLPSLETISIANNKVNLALPGGQVFRGLPVKSVKLPYSGISNIAFLEDIIPTTLDLSGNPFNYGDLKHYMHSLGSVRDATFQKLGITDLSHDFLAEFPRVQYLDLSYNNLTRIMGTAFRHTVDLEILNLSHNKLNKLVDFDMSIGKLQHLFLNDNQIRDISKISFEQLKDLITLDLRNNQIQAMQESLKALFERVDSLSLNGNPFHCNCELLWFRNWLNSGRSSVATYCKTPMNRAFLELRDRDFICVAPQIKAISSNELVSEGDSMMLGCVGEGDPAPVMAWSAPWTEGEAVQATPSSDAEMSTKNSVYLGVNNIDGSKKGLYSCTATNMMGTATNYTSVMVVSDEVTTGGEQTTTAQKLTLDEKTRNFLPNIWIIIIVLGSIIVILIGTVILGGLVIRRKNKSREYEVNEIQKSMENLYKSSETLSSGVLMIEEKKRRYDPKLANEV